MSSPLFSIIIPTCDRPHLLRYTLQAALAVSHPSFEVVVSDNFSAPETYDLVARLKDDRVRYVRTERRLHMPDNWQFGFNHSRGDYSIILGDDDGIVPTALNKLEQIFRATGAELATWRNFGYYHPDWPSKMRNTVMVGHVTRNLSLIAAEYMLRQANVLEHPARFEFPHGSRFCFSRRLAQAVTRQCGRVFDIPYPDFTSALYMLAVLKDSHYAYYDGPVTFTTYSYNSNSAVVLSRKKRNTRRAEAFYREFDRPLYEFAPLKSHLIWNGHADCVLRMHAKFALPETLRNFDYPRYFLICYRGIVEDDLSDITKAKPELLEEFWAVLGAQSGEVRAAFELLQRDYEKRGSATLAASGGVRRLVRTLPRGVKEALKGSRLVRQASEAVLGHAIALAGDKHGFANIAELCERMEALIGGEEPFVREVAPETPRIPKRAAGGCDPLERQ
jgi:glycosyltransferase involved in cell wall biosynthesis